MIPVIIDTGVFVAGVFWRLEAHRCVNAWLQGMVALGISAAIFREYERSLRKIQTSYGFKADLDQWLTLVRDFGQWVQPWPLAGPVCRDPKDDI